MIRSTGEMKYLIDVQEPLPGTRRRSGYVPAEWRTWGSSIWAKVEQTGGGESQQADQRQARATYLVTIRYLQNRRPSEKDVVIWRDRTLAIESVRDPDGNERFWEMVCTELRA